MLVLSATQVPPQLVNPSPASQETAETGVAVVVTAATPAPEQAPLVQVWLALQIFPHQPQLLVSTRVFRQAPPHTVWPEAQDTPATGAPVVRLVAGTTSVPVMQAPLLQYWDDPQAAPHRPQLLASTSVFRQAPPQVVCPSEQPPAGAAPEGTAEGDRAGETVWISVSRAGGVLLVLAGSVHPLAMTRQRMIPVMRTGVRRGAIFIKGTG
jgi:hypothetical protein